MGEWYMVYSVMSRCSYIGRLCTPKKQIATILLVAIMTNSCNPLITLDTTQVVNGLLIQVARRE